MKLSSMSNHIPYHKVMECHLVEKGCWEQVQGSSDHQSLSATKKFAMVADVARLAAGSLSSRHATMVSTTRLLSLDLINETKQHTTTR